MKKWHRKSLCVVSFQNTDVKIAAANCEPPLLQIALHSYWKDSLRLNSPYSVSALAVSQFFFFLEECVHLFMVGSFALLLRLKDNNIEFSICFSVVFFFINIFSSKHFCHE
jgi:hypothetical protein